MLYVVIKNYFRTLHSDRYDIGLAGLQVEYSTE